MKKTLYSLILLFTLVASAQIPVTDAATNTSVGITNSRLKDINQQLETVNKNLSELVDIMDKNNDNNSKAREILNEELEAKKNTPEYVMKSTDVNITIDLKDKILKAYGIAKNSIRELKYLERDEIEEFSSYATNAILETKQLFMQCNEILKTESIIPPEERLKKISGINSKLVTLLDNLIAHNNKFSQLNSFRKVNQSLINLNKD